MNKFKVYVINIIIYFYIILTTAQRNVSDTTIAIAKPHAVVCGDIRVTLFELRLGSSSHPLISCEISLGSVTFAPMNTVSNESTTALIRFPYLREVHGFMLLGYSSMRSFSSMFPRLSVIHGRTLYLGYSLIVMNNFLLDNIGLTSLINIRRGNIIIARNAHLCYAKSIRWNDIMETRMTHVKSRQNRDNCAICPTCPVACWAPTQCQQRCPLNCPRNCLSETVCCPEQCVGGCHYGNETMKSNLTCNACTNMRIFATGICVDQCPKNMLQASESLCVTREECRSLFMGSGSILEEINECVLSCPSGFIHMPDSSCVRCRASPENNYCNGACREKYIQSIEDFHSLKYCSRVHTLNIYNIEAVESKGTSFYEAFTAFQSLEQVDYEFTIHNVKIFSTLAIFSRLHRIGIASNASMTIEENDFLTELWPSTQQSPIVQGTLNIVRNARLCLNHIDEFINHTNSHEPDLQVTTNTLNEYANGYLASCASNFLKITVNKIRSSTATVNIAIPIDMFRSSDTAKYLRRPFLSVYYKPTRAENATHFDATGSSKWLRVVEKVNYNLSPHGGSLIMSVQLTSLIGYQLYAAYASITSNLNTIGLFSHITYFITAARQPEPILNLRGESLSSSSIELVWEPPAQPNGPIITYLVYYAPMEDRLSFNNSKLLCLMKDRWLSEVLDQTNDFNKTQLPHCSRTKSSNRMMSDNDDANRDESHFNIEENTSVDQAITDLSILEYQLINSVSRRNDPVSITEELKNAIINHLDHYFADKDADVYETSELDYQEQSVVAHKPYINQYNQSTSDIRIIIDNLNEAQMYMFQVYACSDITKPSLSDFCSLNGITKEIRTQPGDPSRDLVRNVRLIAPSTDNSDHPIPVKNTVDYQITWSEPLKPNGFIYYYMVYLLPENNNNSWDGQCVGYDIYSINVSLLPLTVYHLRIVTFTIARLNNAYGDIVQMDHVPFSLNSTELYFELTFTTKDVPGGEAARRTRIIISTFIISSLALLLLAISGALLYYYYRYSRNHANTRPPLGFLLSTVYDSVNERIRSYAFPRAIV